MPSAQKLDTHHKALTLNLDPSTFGSFAEIGAGQEVARWFLVVGGASGTVAKTISAYDKEVSDDLYGSGSRYVSKQRLEAMLDNEWAQLRSQLDKTRGWHTRFFSFVDTVSARNYAGTNDSHGWVGFRFQMQPGGPPILIAAEPGVDAAVQRAGRLGLGLNPGISDWKSLEHQLATFRAAVPAGESPGPIVVRVNNPVTEAPLEEAGRGPLSGSVDQITRDLLRAAELGVDEVMWDLTQAEVPYDVQLTLLDQLITARPAESVARRREL